MIINVFAQAPLSWEQQGVDALVRFIETRFQVDVKLLLLDDGRVVFNKAAPVSDSDSQSLGDIILPHPAVYTPTGSLAGGREPGGKRLFYDIRCLCVDPAAKAFDVEIPKIRLFRT